MMAVGKNKKRKRSKGNVNPSSDDECFGGDGKDSMDAAVQETERTADLETVIISSSEESSRKITSMVSSSGIGTDHDDKICDRDGNEKGKGARFISGDQSNAEAGALCGICLSEGKELDRGKLDCCGHFFCFVCIMEWAKVESRCPLCKQRFVTIVKPPTADTLRSRGRTIRIPTRNQVYVPSREDGPVDPYANTVCMECLESGTQALLLLCDGCDSAAHTYCIGLGSSVPRGDWYCQSCKSVFVDEASSDSSDNHHESATSHDEGNEELELSEDDLSDISSLAEASRVFLRRSRLTRRAGSTSGSQLRRSGCRRTRRCMPTGRTGNAYVAFREFAVQEPMPPSRLLPSSSINARTLTRQRQLQDRIQCMRENWNSIRSGSVDFGETQHCSVNNLGPAPLKSPSSLPLDASHSNHGTMLNSSGPCKVQFLKASSTQIKLKADVDKAWGMLEQAKALIDASGTATQNTTGEPNVRHHERNPRAASLTDSFARQSSNFFLFKDNPMSLHRFIKDYEKPNSFGSSSSAVRAEAGKSVTAESPLSNNSKDMKILSNDLFPGDAGKWDHTRKNVGAETRFSESGIKGKSTIPPTNEQTRALNCCRETVQGTSLVEIEWREPHMKRENVFSYGKKSEQGGELRNGHLHVFNDRSNFCKPIADFNDPSIARHEVISRNKMSMNCNGETVSPTGVSAFNTGSYTFDDLNVQSSYNIKNFSRLEHTGNGSLQNLIKNQQYSMDTNLISSPLTLFSNSATSHAQHDKLNSIPLGLQNSSEMKCHQLSSEGVVYHKKLDVVVHVRNKHQSREESASKARNTLNGNGEKLPQREALKDLVLKITSQILTPLLKSHKIGKEKYKEIARSTTHHLLAAYGLDHNKKLVHSVEALSCSHVSGNVSSNVLDRFCSQCLNERVTRVLGTLIDGIEAPLIEH